MTAALFALAALVPSPGVDLVVPTPGGATRLRVVVTVDGRSPEAAWAAFLDRLFTHFDRDGDGALSPDEAGRVIPLPLPDGRSASFDFAKIDADGDGRATRAEFRAFWRAAGFAPVVAVVRPLTAEQARLAAAVFTHLDRDGDGTLSATELADAPSLLRRFDDNEDEVLGAAELLAGAPEPPPAGTMIPLRAEPPKGDADGRLRLGGATPAFEPPGFAVPGLRVLPQALGGETFRATKEFFLAQFADALGRRTALPRDEAESSPGLEAVAAMFAPADRDGDGQLTAKELAAFLDLVELGVSCQALVTAEDRGPSVFDLLDANGDGRLDLPELRRAARLTPTTRGGVPRQYRVSASRGPVGTTFGPVPVPAAPPAKAAGAARPPGPAWFWAMDRNGDGFLSPAEFRGTPAHFRTLDRDGDGRVSAAEAAGRPD